VPARPTRSGKDLSLYSDEEYTRVKHVMSAFGEDAE
jgi:hypothetical protein